MDLSPQRLFAFRSFRGARRPLAVAVCLAAGLVFGQGLAPAQASDPAVDFPPRLAAALISGPTAWDHLWAPGARDQTRRVLDAHVGSLFDWTNVHVTATATHPLAKGEGGAPRVAVTLLLTGTASWRERAWGVAQSFWTLQCDERKEANAVVRREEWALEQRGDAWLAVERRSLGTLQLVEARIAADVYPSQDALLVEGSYHVRALADSVSAVRFFLDRRASVYDLRVNGKLTGVVRGNELGSLGLEGYAPELESSFAFATPLKAGEEALVTFRLRAPLVHMTGEGFVTSLPIKKGPFGERLWLPILAPTGTEGSEGTHVEATWRWPADEFATLGIAGPPGAFAAPITAGDEEASVSASWTGDVRDADFVLLAPNVDPAKLSLPMRWNAQAPAGRSRGARRYAAASRSCVEARGLLAPLLAESYASSRDRLGASGLLPLDDQVLNEMSDDSATNAEHGAEDRQAQ
jgi:hypothetical protein